jgi:Ca2+/Na+ antiporter
MPSLVGYSVLTVDLLVETSLSGQGYQLMAITGVFSSQLFNILVGFSTCSFIKAFRAKHSDNFSLLGYPWHFDRPQRLIILVLLGCLIYTFYIYVKVVKINQ